MSEYQEPSELKKAEPWLRSKAERLAARMDQWHYDATEEQVVEQILFQLKVAYSEGYADRIKAEATEAVSPPPKKRKKK